MSYIPDWVRWSPDSRRIRFSVQDPRTLSFTLWEVSADGSNLHALLPGWNNPPAECCGTWTRDGKYFLFQSTRNGRTDLWAIPEAGNLFRRASWKPMQLTAGPMSFLSPDASRNGRDIFALGVQRKNELVRFDSLSKQFVPYLSGMSAEGVAFSKEGRWTTYVAIPQGYLWRSKLDGSEAPATQLLSLTGGLSPLVARWHAHRVHGSAARQIVANLCRARPRRHSPASCLG